MGVVRLRDLHSGQVFLGLDLCVLRAQPYQSGRLGWIYHIDALSAAVLSLDRDVPDRNVKQSTVSGLQSHFGD